MVAITALWLPILLSAVAVFFLSSLMHMVMSYHHNDFSKINEEDQVLADLGKASIKPGEYMMPFATDKKERQSQAFLDKLNKGPVAFMTVLENGMPGMGMSLFLWFIYCLVVGIFAAYIAGHALASGAGYLEVFRFAGCTAFIGYSLALWQNSIWYKRSLLTTLKFNFDGLVYALFTAGIFGWLWPV